MAKNSNIKRLRSLGYMTPEEFVDKIVPGLKEYLGHEWRSEGEVEEDQLKHPEDLISNAENYMKVAYHVIVDFGVSGPRKPNKTTAKALKKLLKGK